MQQKQPTPTYKRVYQHFVSHVTDNKIQVENAIDVVRSIAYIVDGLCNLPLEEKKKLVIETLEDIVAGPDGILYTDDDLLPRHVVEGIEILIRTNIIVSTIELVFELSQAKASVGLVCYIYRMLGFVFTCCCCRKRTKTKKNSSNVLDVPVSYGASHKDADETHPLIQPSSVL